MFKNLRHNRSYTKIIRTNYKIYKRCKLLIDADSNTYYDIVLPIRLAFVSILKVVQLQQRGQCYQFFKLLLLVDVFLSKRAKSDTIIARLCIDELTVCAPCGQKLCTKSQFILSI